MKRVVFAAALTVSLSAAASAQTTTEFYVVQDVKTKKCTIVEKRPTTTTEFTVLGTTVFKTRSDAESGMRTEKVCVSNLSTLSCIARRGAHFGLLFFYGLSRFLRIVARSANRNWIGNAAGCLNARFEIAKPESTN